MGTFKKPSLIKGCFYHEKNECKGDIKQSHSVQRNGRLSIVESDINGNNSIYTFTGHAVSKNNFLEDLIPIGKAQASTFFGFCAYHDTSLFSEIENKPFDHSDKPMFLHSYR